MSTMAADALPPNQAEEDGGDGGGASKEAVEPATAQEEEEGPQAEVGGGGEDEGRGALADDGRHHHSDLGLDGLEINQPSLKKDNREREGEGPEEVVGGVREADEGAEAGEEPKGGTCVLDDAALSQLTWRDDGCWSSSLRRGETT